MLVLTELDLEREQKEPRNEVIEVRRPLFLCLFETRGDERTRKTHVKDAIFGLGHINWKKTKRERGERDHATRKLQQQT